MSENDSNCGSTHENEDMEVMDTERSTTSTPLIDISSSSISPHLFHEIELVFKPLPHQMDDQDMSLSQTRFIKTTTNASVDHLVKYLSMRHILDRSNGDAQQDVRDPSSGGIIVYHLRGHRSRTIPASGGTHDSPPNQ